MSVNLAERKRSRRSDAGAVRMQERDAAALAWVAEQFGAPWDVLSVLLGRLAGRDRISISSVRQAIRRWESARWVTSHRLPGGVWVTPTARALEMVARPDYHAIEPWLPQVPRLPHVRAVALVRLALEGSGTPGQWVSDRLLEQEIRMKRWGGQTVRRPDALVRFPDGRELGLEVELTVKSAMRYRGIVDHTKRDLSAVQWLTWPEHVERLKTLLWDAKEQGRHPVPIEVTELPRVTGTYPEPWELPYEAWRPTR